MNDRKILLEPQAKDLSREDDKKPYQRPELIKHGAVESLTQQPVPPGTSQIFT